MASEQGRVEQGESSNEQSGAKEILSQIFSCIGELSDALASPKRPTSSSSSVGISDTVENEVSKVFGRQHSPSSVTTNRISNSATQGASTAQPSVAVSSQKFHRPTPSYNTKRFFGNQRSAIKSNRWRKGKEPKTKKVSTGPFSRDIILLSGPDDNDIPRQGSKVFLQQNGHIISAFQFHKEWSDIDVEIEIRQAFQGTLPDDVDVEIVHSVHTTLLKPTLAPGQYLTGSVINRVFSNNKPVYIRPSKQILNQPMSNREKRPRHNLPDNVFDDDDDDDDWMSLALNENSFDTMKDGMKCLDKPIQQVPSNNQSEASEHETSSQLEQTKHDIPDTAVIDLMQYVEPLSDVIQNQFQVDMEEPDYRDVIINAQDNQVEEDTQLVKEIAVNRNNVLKDMIIAFKDEMILSYCLEIVFIDERGNIEDGRGSGVKREALSIFWREFYNSLATGASEKVPAIRHDYQQSEWKSIARVLVIGFTKFAYFPVTLSSAFIASCLFPEELLAKEWLVESFHQYISKDESETLKRSVTEECSDPSTDEDVIDVLTSYKCRRVVSKDTMPKIIEELAHQEIIQRPKYVGNAWSPIVNKLKRFKEFETIDSLLSVYEAKKPTQKKVCKLLISNPSTDAQRECFSHLKRFVKSLDDNLVSVFLQYVTGSNIIAVDSIEVAFSEESGKTRRPVAHTCAPLLVVPSTYQSYNELSEEFSNIFRREAAWSFYIV